MRFWHFWLFCVGPPRWLFSLQKLFPHLPGRVSRFYQSCFLLLLLLLLRQPRISTASSGSKWALPDLNRELRMSGTAGPQPLAPDLSEYCRRSRLRFWSAHVREKVRINVRCQNRMPDRMAKWNVRIDASIECQSICQKECQKSIYLYTYIFIIYTYINIYVYIYIYILYPIYIYMYPNKQTIK